MRRIFLLAVILASASGCALRPGPDTGYMGGLSEAEVIQAIDKQITKLDPAYPILEPMKGCPPLKIQELLDEGVLEIHKVGTWEAVDRCMCGMNPETKAMMYALGSFAYSCVIMEFTEQCKPEWMQLYYSSDEHNANLAHELSHVVGYADKGYTTVEWDNARCE